MRSDEQILRYAKELVLDMYQRAQAMVLEGKSYEEIAAECFPAGAITELVCSNDLKEIGRADAPNGTRIWVYRHLGREDACYMIGIAKRSVMRLMGSCHLTSFAHHEAS